MLFRSVVFRLNSYSSPEYLEDAIQRIRTLLSLPSLTNRHLTSLAQALETYVQRHSSYLYLTVKSPSSNIYPFSQIRAPDQPDSVSEGGPQMLEKVDRLWEIFATIEYGG